MDLLLEQGCPYDEQLCSFAVIKGHLHVIQWAQDNGIPWSTDTCRSTVDGHLHILQWLRANGCPWDYTTPGMLFLTMALKSREEPSYN